MKLTYSPIITEIRGTLGATTFKNSSYGPLAHLKSRGKANLCGATAAVQDAYQAARPSVEREGSVSACMNLPGGSGLGVSAVLAETTHDVTHMIPAERNFWLAAITKSELWKEYRWEQHRERNRISNQYRNYQRAYEDSIAESYINERKMTGARIPYGAQIFVALLLPVVLNIWHSAKEQRRLCMRATDLKRVEGRFWPVIAADGTVYYTPLYKSSTHGTPDPTDDDWVWGYVRVSKRWIPVNELEYYPEEYEAKVPKSGWRGPINFGPLSLGETDLGKYLPWCGDVLRRPDKSKGPATWYVRDIWLRIGLMNPYVPWMVCGPPGRIPFLNKDPD